MQDASGRSADTTAPAWPAATLKEIEVRLCAPGQKFEMETVEVAGVPTRSWKNQPPNLAALARFARTGFSERLFTIYEDERVTFESWFRATAALAAEMRRLGVGKGDRVALCMRNLPEWPAVFFAATSLGAIINPLNAWWTGPELAFGLSDSGSRLLVCDAERWARIAPHRAGLAAMDEVLVARFGAHVPADVRTLEGVIGAPGDWARLPDLDLPEVEVAPDDPATLFYTSGTTGRPKGALGSHRNILACPMAGGYVAARTAMRRGETPPEPARRVVLLVIPLFHVTACCSVLMGSLAGGATLVLMRKWDALRGLELIERERVNAAGGVPFVAWEILDHPERGRFDLSSLESVAYGGAPSAPELARRIKSDLGAMPGNGWGMTETSATVTNHAGEDYLHRPDSAGPPLPVSDLKVMSPDGDRELAAGEVGELWARGPQIVLGYWNNPEATAKTFVDGWCRTGDLARLDAEGFLYIVDRAKDVVIRGGENIYACEVENALYEHPAVTDAALVGAPHRTLGEEPAAVVHLAVGQETTEPELQAWVRARLAGFKVPVRVLIQPDPLPRNANGKILKAELRALFDERALAAV